MSMPHIICEHLPIQFTSKNSQKPDLLRQFPNNSQAISHSFRSGSGPQGLLTFPKRHPSLSHLDRLKPSMISDKFRAIPKYHSTEDRELAGCLPGGREEVQGDYPRSFLSNIWAFSCEIHRFLRSERGKCREVVREFFEEILFISAYFPAKLLACF